MNKRAEFLATFPAPIAYALRAHKVPTHFFPARYERVGGVLWFVYARALLIRSAEEVPAGAEKMGLASVLLRSLAPLRYVPTTVEWSRETVSTALDTRIVPVGYTAANANLVRVVEQLFPGCEWFVSDRGVEELDPVVAVLRGERVAYLSPFSPPTEGTAGDRSPVKKKR